MDPLANPGNDGNTTQTNSDGQQQLLAGKYKNEQELERAYLHQQTETNKIIARQRELETRVEAYKSLVGENGERSNPAERSSVRQSALDLMAEALNVPKRDLEAAFQEAARPLVQRELSPFTSGFEAQQIVARENPDFGRYQGEVAQFLAANTDLQARVNRGLQSGDANEMAMAMEYAHLKWQQSLAKSGQNAQGGTPNNPFSDTATHVGGTRNASNGQAPENEMAALAEALRKDPSNARLQEDLARRAFAAITMKD